MMYILTNEEKYLNKIINLLNEITERLNNEEYGLTYCDGLTGISFMFHFLNEKNILTQEVKAEIEDSLTFLDECLLEYAMNNTSNIQETDFLHGAFGTVHYLNERISNGNLNNEIKASSLLLFEKVARLVIDDVNLSNNVATLKDIDENSHKTNCGLAHGNVSNILIFAKLVNNFPQNEIITKAFRMSIECLLSFENDIDDELSLYPSIAVNKSSAVYNIPLGWCYGDQTISLALHYASRLLKDKKLENKALKLAERNLETIISAKMFPTPNYDAAFCHGLSSIAYLNKKWYNFTGDEKYLTLYEELIMDIINKGNHEDVISGYKKVINHDVFEYSIGFLDGSLGIGIVLIDYLLEHDENWDRFFLLN